jgi:hypothetical protein
MRKYGFKIGNVGVEFSSMEDRQKAILTFTKSSTVNITNNGIKYLDADGAFSVYDRDTTFVIVTCEECMGEFSIETAPKQTYEYKPSYSNDYDKKTGHICVACFAALKKEKEIFDATALLQKTAEAEL